VSTLHVTNGDCAADIIRRIVDDPVIITADVLHEGPAPAVDGEAWHEVRGTFLGNGHGSAAEISRQLASTDRAIADAGNIVLWFEHDLFDQLALIRTLDLLSRPRSAGLKPGPTYDASAGLKPRPSYDANVSLICIDRFPGIDRFIGLGQLSSDQLATLLGTERPVTDEQYALASEAWTAFRSPDPAALLKVVADPDRSRALPFLRDALLRFLAEFPSVVNGLSRTEELAIGVLADGPRTGGALFAATQALEPRPFIGDSTFFDVINRLASGRVPLVTVENGATNGDLRPRTVAITAEGRRVLKGERDHVALNGIDLWRGGVHLAGADRSPWRWDAKRETLVS
jgi:hypothetical protein